MTHTDFDPPKTSHHLGKAWETRKSTAVFRGGINDRACYPITELGGDEVGAVDSSYAHTVCGRKRLLEIGRCFPTVRKRFSFFLSFFASFPREDAGG